MNYCKNNTDQLHESEIKIPVTAVIHTFNDSSHLEECLKSIHWCDEIIVVDLGSIDRSVEISKHYADKTYKHDWVPIADQVRSWSYSKAKHDFILCVDPDEVYNVEIAQRIIELFNSGLNFSALSAPMQFYFRRKPLKCCMWYPNKKIVLKKRRNVVESGEVHSSTRINGNVVEIEWGSAEAIKHYWKDSWAQFLSSHWRYVKLEGRARYCSGKRFGFSIFVKQVARMFMLNFYEKNGWRGGIDGILLSFSMLFYELFSQVSLFFYQFKLKFFTK